MVGLCSTSLAPHADLKGTGVPGGVLSAERCPSADSRESGNIFGRGLFSAFNFTDLGSGGVLDVSTSPTFAATLQHPLDGSLPHQEGA